MSIALAALMPLIGALLAPLTIRSGRTVCAISAGAASLLALVLLLSHAPAVYRGEIVRQQIDWVPQLGLSFSFFVDGLGLFFASLILGIGLLIIVYARFYLSRGDPMGRFYVFLLLFQSAMLGVALSDNILLLLVFWEVTSLSSFLLIGYWHHLPEGRQGARMALVVTGGGGLLLIAGMLMLGHIAGSYEITEILQRGDAIKAHPLYVPTLLLILAGAFTKSAQFPFHFWLPHAMAAPTPVSAYLHSATMVKAGVFLLARLWPALAGTEIWTLIVAPVGLITMIVGAWIAIFKDDLKALLAFSTVSHLGMMTMLLGFGTPLGAVVAVFHMLNHATFKAALFMSAGIVDHETGTRDIRRLGGLWRLMPISSALAMLAAASMAGLPLLNGFLSKEMMLEEAAHTELWGIPYLVPVMATLGAVFSVAYSARLVFHAYLGSARDVDADHLHDPPIGLWGPVAVLVVPVVAIGLFPPLAGPVVARTAMAVTGMEELPYYSLAIWHGVTPALIMSLVAFAAGGLIVGGYAALSRGHGALPRPDAKAMFDAVIAGLIAASRGFTHRLHTGSLQRYIAVILITVIAVGAVAFQSGGHAPGGRETLPADLPAIIVWGVLLATCAAVVVVHGNRLLTLILTSVAGLVVSLAFLQFSAPDLALTQISVEVVTTILLLLALNLMPRRSDLIESLPRRFGGGLVAIAVGAGVGMLSYAVMTRSIASISEYHLDQSKPGGGGTNVVNVILVDFRGFDTMGEIVVLGAVALTAYALLRRFRPASDSVDVTEQQRDQSAFDASQPDRKEGDTAAEWLFIPSLIARLLFPVILMVALFLLLRGHDLPGGGFAAGLTVAIAMILQYMFGGIQWVEARLRVLPMRWMGIGILLAGGTGLGAWIFGRPFLTSYFTYAELPVLGKIPVASALLFDIGVFALVVGATILILIALARQSVRGHRAASPRPAEMPAVPEPVQSGQVPTAVGDD